MDTLEFKRCDGSGGNVSRRLINDQQLVDKQFTKCVMCGTNKPYRKEKSTYFAKASCLFLG